MKFINTAEYNLLNSIIDKWHPVILLVNWTVNKMNQIQIAKATK